MVDFPLVRALTSQLEIRDALLHEGAERVGWKLGLGDSERIGGHIAVGHLTSRTCLAAGASYVPEDPAAELHADAEIAVELGRDLVPDAPTEAARRAVRGYAVALEICDLQQLPDDAQAIVAENVLHRAVAFGPWRAKLPTRMTASLLVNGEIQDAAQAESDLAARLCAAARVLGAVGERLRAGDRIITSLVVQVPIHPGDGVIGNMGELGRVGLRIRPMAETALDREGN